MFLVDQPTLTPAQCMLTKRSGIPCVDLGRDFDFDHAGRMYIAVTAARDLGKLAGLVEPSEGDGDALAAAEARVVELEDRLAAAEEFIAAIDVIESKDFRTRKKAGRKPAAKKEAPVG